jgi:hypothetical protein
MIRAATPRLVAAALLCAGIFSVETAAQPLGTESDARAMLQKTVAAIAANRTKTLERINKGDAEFLQGDVYPFCFNLSDGKTVAIADPSARQLIGVDVRTNKDSTGKAFGQELYAAATTAAAGKQAQITEVTYMAPKPGSEKTPAQKVTLVTAVNDLGCAVGYYKIKMAD